MTQYVLQVKNDTKQLIKSYEVSEDCPIRPIEQAHLNNRKQIVIEDTEKFNEVCEVYKQYKLNAKFTLNEETNEVSWEIE